MTEKLKTAYEAGKMLQYQKENGEGWNYSLDVKVKAEQFLGGER